MTFAITLMQRFGLFMPKADTSEAFELRLTRITLRDARRATRAQVFVKPAL